jgi:hypothetical protein
MRWARYEWDYSAGFPAESAELGAWNSAQARGEWTGFYSSQPDRLTSAINRFNGDVFTSREAIGNPPIEASLEDFGALFHDSTEFFSETIESNTFVGSHSAGYFEILNTRIVWEVYDGIELSEPYTWAEYTAAAESLCAAAVIDDMLSELQTMVSPENAASRPWGLGTPSVVSFWRRLWTISYDATGQPIITRADAVNPISAGNLTFYLGESDPASYQSYFYTPGQNNNASFACLKSAFYDLRSYLYQPGTFSGCLAPSQNMTYGVGTSETAAIGGFTTFESDLGEGENIRVTRFGV